jgi:hypothetical protein
VINAGKRLKFKLQGEYGEGFENYIADVRRMLHWNLTREIR